MKYKIIDVYPNDAFYGQREQIIGKTGHGDLYTFRNDVGTAGIFHFEPILTLVHEGDVSSHYESLYFFSIKVEPV